MLRTLTTRRLAVVVTLCVAIGAFVLVVTACGDEDSAGPSGTTTQGPVTGGIVHIGLQPAAQFDPPLVLEDTGMFFIHQVYEPLFEISADTKAVPLLATGAESSPDGTVWTVSLRTGVEFQNGDAFDAEDVVYSFKRMMDPEIGGVTVDVYQNVKSVEARDAQTVVFTLKEPVPDFDLDLGDYHAVMTSSTVANPAEEYVGTGPFKVVDVLPEDRITLERNPTYWMEDDQGKQLPYLDGVEMVFSPDVEGHIEGLRGGTTELVLHIPPESAAILEGDSSVNLLQGPSNTHYLLKIRCDGDRVGADNNVRKALKLGTDHAEILEVAQMGAGSVGNSTPVGPMYEDYYLDQPPTYDPEEAKKLLAEAGYADGLTIDLVVMRFNPLPTIATVWKQQMEKIGVNVKIQTVPVDVYYGEGDLSWLVVDWGFTDWLTKAKPSDYFKMGLVSDASWNETHWSDPEFDEITNQILSEMDLEKRVELYHQAQQILIDRGPEIVFYIVNPTIGTSANLVGFTPCIPESSTSLRSVYLTQ